MKNQTQKYTGERENTTLLYRKALTVYAMPNGQDDDHFIMKFNIYASVCTSVTTCSDSIEG
jgi:hypothetical protein